MIKTKHVLRITNKIKKELRDMFLTGSLINSQYILDCLYKINAIEKQLKTKSGILFSDPDEYINIMNIMSAIFEASGYESLSAEALERIYHEDSVDPALLSAISNFIANSSDSKVLEEVSTIKDFIELSPNVALCQEDMYSKFRIFELISSQKDLCKFENSSRYVDLLPEFKYVKVYHSTLRKYSSFSKKEINSARKHLIEELGVNDFSKIKNEFETYFQIGMTSTYYIYIPTI